MSPCSGMERDLGASSLLVHKSWVHATGEGITTKRQHTQLYRVSQDKLLPVCLSRSVRWLPITISTHNIPLFCHAHPSFIHTYLPLLPVTSLIAFSLLP